MHILQATTASALSLPSGTYIYAISAAAGRQFAAISSDDSIRLFDGQFLQPVGVVSAKSHDGVTALKEFRGVGNAHGFLLATAGRDGVVRLWDSRSGHASGRPAIEMRIGMYPILLLRSTSCRQQVFSCQIEQCTCRESCADTVIVL